MNLKPLNLIKRIHFGVSYHQKPSIDLRKPLEDDLDFRNLWSPEKINSNLNPIQKNNEIFLKTKKYGKISLKQSLFGLHGTHYKEDLKAITTMIKGSV